MTNTTRYFAKSEIQSQLADMAIVEERPSLTDMEWDAMIQDQWEEFRESCLRA